jgi:hypothetical protein
VPAKKLPKDVLILAWRALHAIEAVDPPRIYCGRRNAVAAVVLDVRTKQSTTATFRVKESRVTFGVFETTSQKNCYCEREAFVLDESDDEQREIARRVRAVVSRIPN